MVDTEVVPASRRDRLSLYREQLRPSGVSVFVTTAWIAPGGGAGFHLARCGRGARFRANEVALVGQLLPMIRLADGFARTLDRERFARTEGVAEAWAEQMGLTPAERKVTLLVARGLTNREAAELLGLSEVTARNQLASVFRKSNVSTRAELAFLCRSEAPSTSVLERSEYAWVKHIGDPTLLGPEPPHDGGPSP